MSCYAQCSVPGFALPDGAAVQGCTLACAMSPACLLPCAAMPAGLYYAVWHCMCAAVGWVGLLEAAAAAWRLQHLVEGMAWGLACSLYNQG